jgi:NADH:ubiquinone oxidoreductase subunit 6 (subunit J)
MGNFLVWVVWFVAAAGCVGSGIAVVTLRNPFFCALALIANLAALAVLFLLLSAEFVAAAQVLVNAGAVMVMFLFVIAYFGDRASLSGRAEAPRWQTLAAVVAAGAILVEVVVAVGLVASDRLTDAPEVPSSFGSPSEIGELFLTDFLLAFEITSIVLLVAAVGGVILGNHGRRILEPAPDAADERTEAVL